MTIPSGLFAPSKKIGLPKLRSRPFVPLDWLLQHPATRRTWSQGQRNNVSAVEQIDPVFQLADGFEGIMMTCLLTGKAGAFQGPNSGTAWRLFIDGVPYFQTNWTFGTGGTSNETNGRFDTLVFTDNVNSWDPAWNVWVPEGALVQMGMNNTGGDTGPMGWVIMGAYWPIVVRDEWAQRGWRK